jgi:hypothetical protein
MENSLSNETIYRNGFAQWQQSATDPDAELHASTALARTVQRRERVSLLVSLSELEEDAVYHKFLDQCLADDPALLSCLPTKLAAHAAVRLLAQKTAGRA